MPKGAIAKTVKKPMKRKNSSILPALPHKKGTEKISQKGNTRKRN